jgi:hypothetical protein
LGQALDTLARMHLDSGSRATDMIFDMAGPFRDRAPQAVAFEVPDHAGYSTMIELPLGAPGPWFAWTQFWMAPGVPGTQLPDATVAVTGPDPEERANLRRNMHLDVPGSLPADDVAVSALIDGADVPLATLRTPSGALHSEVDHEGLLLVMVQQRPLLARVQLRPVSDGVAYADRTLLMMLTSTTPDA